MTRRLLPALLLLTLALPAAAVDLTKHTVGVGASADLAQVGTPAQLSVRFPLKPRLIADLLVGFQAAPGVTFAPGLQVDWVLLAEEHMNLLASVAVGVDVRSSTGLEAFVYRVGPAVELFASDWPNLGFLLGFGFSGALVPGTNTAAQPGVTTSLSPLGLAGLHYYF